MIEELECVKSAILANMLPCSTIVLPLTTHLVMKAQLN